MKQLWAYKYWEELIWFGALVVTAIITLYLINFLIWLLAPFILAWLLSLVLRPVIRFLDRRLKLGRSISVALAMFLVVGFGSIFLFFLVSRLIFEIKRLGHLLPLYFDQSRNQFNDFFDQLREIAEGFSPEFSQAVERSLSGVTTGLEQVTGQVMQIIFQFSFFLPELLVILIIALVATYFLCIEYERIKRGFRRLIPQPWRESLGQALTGAVQAFKGLLRAQAILFGITLIQLLIGFWLLGIKKWVLFAFLVFLVDLLPIVGTGVVLLPWALWLFIIKKPLLAMGILVLYGIILITRNILTPKLYAESFGLNPLVTLVAMYVGLKLVGLWGLILGPLVLMVLLVFWVKIRQTLKHNKRAKIAQVEQEMKL
ncbi:MAG: sporulation integral membrane protein YtvI [Syntrophomonadaceae bacterium]|nr:sporulation integral membrane protein YtvI [Syntrophomonadaceae bacterium]